MISPTWITPTFVTVAIQSVLEERTAADLRFILHVQAAPEAVLWPQAQILSWPRADASARSLARGVITAPDLDFPAQLSGLTLAQPHHHHLAWQWGLGAAPSTCSGPWLGVVAQAPDSRTLPCQPGDPRLCPTSQLALVAPWQPDQEPLHVCIPVSEKDMFKFCL